MNRLKSQLYRSDWALPALSISVATLSYLGLFKGVFADKIYYQGFFQLWRIIYDYTFGLLPFGSVYLLFIVLFPIFYYVFIIPVKQKSWKKFTIRFLNFLSIIYLLFYIMWGFNYQQQNLSTKLSFPPTEITKEDLLKEISLIHANTLRVRNKLELTNDSIQEKDLPDDLEFLIRKNEKAILASWSLPNNGRVRVRKLIPKGILLRISTAGVYIPFASEGHIDKGLHPVQWPFTMAHEMAHGFGLTDEGECNFVAFVTCMRSKNLIIQYSGLLGYYRYLLSNYRLYYRDEYNEVYNGIHKTILKDIVAINNELNKYPDILPDVRDKIYDSYLKSHGIKDGLHSYSTIIQLVDRWKKSEYNRDLVRQIFPE